LPIHAKEELNPFNNTMSTADPKTLVKVHHGAVHQTESSPEADPNEIIDDPHEDVQLDTTSFTVSYAERLQWSYAQ